MWQFAAYEDSQHAEGEQQSEYAAGEAQQHAFQQQFARNAAAPRAESDADRKFLTAPLGAHQQQVRYVGAGDQQDDSHGGHQHPKRIADVADEDVFERLRQGTEAGFGEHVCARAGLHGESRGSYGQHAGDIGVGFSQGCARFEPCDSEIGEVDEVDVIAIEAEGDDEGSFAIHKPERRRQHADDFARCVIDHNAAADDRAIASETRFPVGVGQDHGALAARVVVPWAEAAPGLWLNAENGEKAIGHEQCREFLRCAEIGDAGGVGGPHGDVLKHAALFAVSDVERGRHANLFHVQAGRSVGDGDELCGLRIRKRLEQHAVDHAEDRSSCADAQCEG